nr:MAG TPA: hypothetical protein [Microviridae sp.]
MTEVIAQTYEKHALVSSKRRKPPVGNNLK